MEGRRQADEALDNDRRVAALENRDECMELGLFKCLFSNEEKTFNLHLVLQGFNLKSTRFHTRAKCRLKLANGPYPTTHGCIIGGSLGKS
jgi:hypothetical protein